MTKIYAMGDIHGHLDQLDRALGLIETDGGRDAPVVFLGDYVDRGPDCAGVIQRLVDGVAAGRDWTCLRGNHDRLFQMFMETGALRDGVLKPERHWFDEKSGGRATMESYGIDVDQDDLHSQALRAVPQSHQEFLANLLDWHQVDDLIFVHAGIRPGVAMEDQVQDDLVWIRDEFLNDPRDHGALIVHGHTMQGRPVHCGNRVNLDGGAGAGRPLIPVVFEGRDCHLLTENGRWPLRPPIA